MVIINSGKVVELESWLSICRLMQEEELVMPRKWICEKMCLQIYGLIFYTGSQFCQGVSSARKATVQFATFRSISSLSFYSSCYICTPELASTSLSVYQWHQLVCLLVESWRSRILCIAFVGKNKTRTKNQTQKKKLALLWRTSAVISNHFFEQ